MPTILLKDVRAAFPVFFEPKTFKGEGEPAYSGSFLLPRDHPQVAEIKAAIKEAAKDKWGEKAGAIVKQLEANDKVCLHDGDAKAEFTGYEGNLYVSGRASADKRPLIIDRDKTPLVAADGKPYAGCYVNVSLEIWAQNNSFGKRINASIRAVQFLRDGDSFGGGTSANVDEFDDLSSGANVELDDVA